MNNEFKQINNGNEVRYVLEDGGSTTTGAVATVEKPLGELQRRAEPPKPRNFVAKNAKMGGAGQHKDKKKAEKQGDTKHKKPFMEDSHPDEKEDKILIRKMVKRDALKKEGYGMGGYETAMGSKMQPTGPTNIESAEEGDVEQELGMAGSELYGIAKHAKELLALIHQQGQEQGLEAWQQSKITKAADYLTAVLQSIDYDTNGDQGVDENGGISKGAETDFHAKLDQLVHNTFGKRKSEKGVAEEWSQKYKSSINCSHPKGFSQRAHCAGKKKHNESVEMESVCPDCGMCQTHGDNMMEVKQRLDAKCWKGKHKEGTKIKGGVRVNNCVPNESVAEDPYFNMLERSVSQAQHNLMVGVAHNPQFAQKVKVKQSVGKEFANADRGHDIKALPVRVPKKK